jgi:hypothetical protein
MSDGFTARGALDDVAALCASVKASGRVSCFSGGTVPALGRTASSAAPVRVRAGYFAATGRRPHLFRGSSPGALAFGAFRLLFSADGATSKLDRIP